MNPSVGIIIVTHNSQDVLDSCLSAIDMQSYVPAQVIIVDSGSDDCSYLSRLRKIDDYDIVFSNNIGFGAGNNCGIKHLKSGCEYVLFLNPDTFLQEDALEKAIDALSGLPEVAILGARLEGYDVSSDRPTGRLDSTGIFRSWYGRWHDRDHGKSMSEVVREKGYVPAVCGAFMFCRISAIEHLFPKLFEESYFMYKEDIELCLRLSKSRWRCYFTPEVRAFHCRGWNEKRTEVSREKKLRSAVNEIRMYLRHPSLYLGWALTKYLLVKFFRV